MARNNDRDIREGERRKQQIIRAGFDLFSEKGIENVSLQAVADAADVGVATVYNYYQNKINLVIAISTAVWGGFWRDSYERNASKLEKANAYEMLELYCDEIIDIYKNRPNILRYSSNYKTFVCREKTDKDLLRVHTDALLPMVELFESEYENAKDNKCIRTDIPMNEIITTVALTMLGMAERYAQGLVWVNNEKNDYTREMIYTKEMLLMWIKGN